MAKRLNVHNLHKGDVIKDYETMCELLNDKQYPVSNRKDRMAQFKKWRRYFDYKRNGNKFIIKEVYDKPLPIKDANSESLDKYGGVEAWNELFEYVEHEIMLYDHDMRMPHSMILRLRGLARGNFMANNKIKPMAFYTFQDILTAFKVAKALMKNKTDFEDDMHRFNYAMTIVENRINDIVKARKSRENVTQKAEELDIGVHLNQKAQYQPSTIDISNNETLNSLW